MTADVLIVAGMHRSGTSLTGACFRAAGVDMGRQLLSADAFNQRGYYEDTGFLALQRAILQTACPLDVDGHPDWGWTEQGTAERVGAEAAFVDRAAALIAERDQRSARWGWKDPRTTLLLDFWLERLPHACFAFVFRAPWEVERSIARLGVRIFTDHLHYPLAIWAAYNRALLRFYRAHPDVCCLLPLRLIRFAAPELVAQTFLKVGLAYDRAAHDEAIARLYDDALLRSPEPEPAWLRDFARRNLEAWKVWRQLNECAESLGPLPLVAANPDPTAKLSTIPAAQPRSATPALSVVIPCYNQGILLLEALESVLRAEDGLYETIIVDDGSDDPATVRIMAEVEAAGWRIIRQSNLGLSAARNAGCEAAAGDYILPLDADNLISPAYIREGIKVLRQSPQVGVVYGDCELFGEQFGRREVPDFDLHRLCLGNYIDACAVIRKQAWRDAGGYDPLAQCFEDWDLWLSIAACGWEFRRLPEVMFSYRVRAGSMLSQGNQPDHFHRVVRHLACKHRYYADHAAELIADLSRIRLSYDESRRISETYVRSLEKDRAQRLQDQLRQAAQLVELESIGRDWAAEREALVAKCLQAEDYARAMEASRAKADAYVRALEAGRAEQAAQLGEFECTRRSWAAEREALVAKCLDAEGYARTLEASRAEAEAYARTLEASRARNSRFTLAP